MFYKAIIFLSRGLMYQKYVSSVNSIHRQLVTHGDNIKLKDVVKFPTIIHALRPPESNITFSVSDNSRNPLEHEVLQLLKRKFKVLETNISL